jgi:hypothetical protein
MQRTWLAFARNATKRNPLKRQQSVPNTDELRN